MTSFAVARARRIQGVRAAHSIYRKQDATAERRYVAFDSAVIASALHSVHSTRAEARTVFARSLAPTFGDGSTRRRYRSRYCPALLSPVTRSSAVCGCEEKRNGKSNRTNPRRALPRFPLRVCTAIAQIEPRALIRLSRRGIGLRACELTPQDRSFSLTDVQSIYRIIAALPVCMHARRARANNPALHIKLAPLRVIKTRLLRET